MSSGEKVRLGDVITIEKADAPQGESVWMLNLDAVEKNTGRVLEKAMVAPSEVGTSTVPFSSKAVLYSKLRPNLNKVVMPDESGFATSEMLPLVADSNVLDRRYLAAFLRSRVFVNYAVASTAGAKMPRVSKKTVLDAKIRLPEFHAQVKRAGTFSALESQIETVEQQIAQLDQLAKSRFVEMFGDTYLNSKGWPTCKLGDITGFMTSGSRGWAKYYSDKGSYFITIKNVKNCKVDITGVQHVIAPDNKEAARTKVELDDVLISITADLGRTGVVSEEIATHGAYINQHLACIRLATDAITPKFLCYFLESPGGIDQFTKKNQNGVKAGLNFNLVKSLDVQMPPIELQLKFEKIVAQVDKTRAVAQQQVDKLQTLYDSLAQDYFA